MRINITNRVIQLADHVIATGDTVRSAAEKYGISKSTVHKDVSERLAHISPALYAEVKSVLERNKRERHLRGGEATKQKYEHIREAMEKNAPAE